MDAFDKIRSKVQEYPGLVCEIEGDSLSIEPVEDSGFTVWITRKRPGFTVGYSGWHEEFDDEGLALDCFAFGLSDECRLRVTKRGGKPVAWTVESKQKGQWTQDSTTALLLFPLWRRKTVQYLQNRVIQRGREQEAEADAGKPGAA